MYACVLCMYDMYVRYVYMECVLWMYLYMLNDILCIIMLCVYCYVKHVCCAMYVCL